MSPQRLSTTLDPSQLGALEEESGQVESHEGPSIALNAQPLVQADDTEESFGSKASKDSKHGNSKGSRHHSIQVPSTKSLRGSKGGPRLSKGEIRYAISNVEPPSPRVEISKKHELDWHQRVLEACHYSTLVCDATAAAEGFGLDEMKLPDPPLDWYADEISKVCGRSLVPTWDRVLSLQARLADVLQLIDEGELWPVLLEAVTLFAAAAYHIQRAAQVMNREVSALILRREGHEAAPDTPQGQAAAQRPLPLPPFLPRNTNAALADLHLHIAKLQFAGPHLASVLHRLVQGVQHNPVSDVQSALDALPARGNSGGFGSFSFEDPSLDQPTPNRAQMLFLAVPCIEEGMEKLALLATRADRVLAAFGGAHTRGSDETRKQKQIPSLDQDEDFIKEDTSALDGTFDIIEEDEQEIIESAAISEAPKPSAKASARPASASRQRQDTQDGLSSPQVTGELQPQSEASDDSRRAAEQTTSSKPPPAKTKKRRG